MIEVQNNTILKTLQSLKDQNQDMYNSFKNMTAEIVTTIKNHSVETLQSVKEQGKSLNDVLNTYVDKFDTIFEWVENQKQEKEAFCSLESNTSTSKRTFTELESCNSEVVFSKKVNINKIIYCKYTTYDINLQIIGNILEPYYAKYIRDEKFVTSDSRDNFVQDIFNYCDKMGITMSSKSMSSVAKCINEILPNEGEVCLYHSNYHSIELCITHEIN